MGEVGDFLNRALRRDEQDVNRFVEYLATNQQATADRVVYGELTSKFHRCSCCLRDPSPSPIVVAL